jgi:hypothetical protein
LILIDKYTEVRSVECIRHNNDVSLSNFCLRRLLLFILQDLSIVLREFIDFEFTVLEHIIDLQIVNRNINQAAGVLSSLF